MAEKVGKDQPEGRDYCVAFFGFDPDPKHKDKQGNPHRYHFADDYKWFLTEQDAADFVNNKNRMTEYLQKTKLFKTLVERYNENKPFYKIVGAIVKKKQGDGGWMYMLKHEKEIVTTGWKKEFTSDKIVLPEEEREKDPGGRSASVIKKTSY